MLAFLDGRRIRDVELITAGAYFRTVRFGKHRGWIKVTHLAEKHALLVEFTPSLKPVQRLLRERLSDLFDLKLRPDFVTAHLSKDPLLEKSVAAYPGLRVPGAFEGFEMAVRAILGQQITVKAATTLSSRFAGAFGKKIVTPFPELSRLTPLPRHVAKATVDDIAKLGIISARARSIIALARAFDSGALQFEAHADPHETIAQLQELPGIGPWTAHYIAMRALRWSDAFLHGDIALLNNLGRISSKQAEAMSQVSRPWRSYAVLHIWRSLGVT